MYFSLVLREREEKTLNILHLEEARTYFTLLPEILGSLMANFSILNRGCLRVFDDEKMSWNYPFCPCLLLKPDLWKKENNFKFKFFTDSCYYIFWQIKILHFPEELKWKLAGDDSSNHQNKHLGTHLRFDAFKQLKS